MRVLTRDQVRAVDRRAIEEFGIPGMVLMENAGRGVVDILLREAIRGPYLICCGKGNNGGDGFVIARHLDLLGHEVRVLVVGEPSKLAGDAGINYRILEKTDVAIFSVDETNALAALGAEIGQASCVIDALLGTGAKGAPRPPTDGIIDMLNGSPTVRIAVDIPSGLDCDTGVAAGAVFRANHTCTFVAAKPGLLLPAAQEFVGQLHVVHIGVPPCVIEDAAYT